MTSEQEQKKSLESVAVLHLVGALVGPWLALRCHEVARELVL